MDDLKLCDSEYRFMLLVWEAAPVRSGELVRLASDRLGWKKSTTYTVIRKLSERGFLQNEDALVTPLVSRMNARQWSRITSSSGHSADRCPSSWRHSWEIRRYRMKKRRRSEG